MSDFTEQVTNVQHYVPQFYLRGFSKMKKGIYEFDLNGNQVQSVSAGIRGVCQEAWLYEFRDKDGQLDSGTVNCLEKMFMNAEGFIKSHIDNIAKKAEFDENCGISCFLTSLEKAVLVYFIAMLIVRRPDVIELGAHFTSDYFSGANKYSCRNLYLATIFGYKVNTEFNTACSLLKYVASWFDDMSFIVGFAEDANLITSDRPVIVEKDGGYDFENPQPDRVVFPLTSRLLLCLYPRCRMKPGNRNCLYKIDAEKIDEVNGLIVSNADRWLYSSEPLTGEYVDRLKTLV